MRRRSPAAPSRAAAALRLRLALSAAAAVLALACTATPPGAWLDRAPVPGAAEDATAGFYAPDEVDAVAHLVTPIAPPYPPHLRERGLEGHVVARILVRQDGSVAGAELLEATNAAFTEVARSEIRGARFAPALLGGRPVPSWVIVRIRFRLA